MLREALHNIFNYADILKKMREFGARRYRTLGQCVTILILEIFLENNKLIEVDRSLFCKILATVRFGVILAKKFLEKKVYKTEKN